MTKSESYIQLDEPLYDDELTEVLDGAVSRLESDLEEYFPFMAEHVLGWMKQLSLTGRPQDYFKNPRSFPLLLLPWWLSRSLNGGVTAGNLDRDIVYSSISGYYYIRLVDNLMDGEVTVERRILPATAFFLANFEGPYRRYFDVNHPFWKTFHATWFRSADAAVEDAFLEDVDETQFTQICAQKFVAGRIPILAVCHHWQRHDLSEPWCRFVDRLGSWHQMQNDLRDWFRDPGLEIETYLLSESRRRRHENESLLDWMIREGDAWGGSLLTRWLAELRTLAEDLECAPVVDYLETRRHILEQECAQRKLAFSTMRRLADAFK